MPQRCRRKTIVGAGAARGQGHGEYSFSSPVKAVMPAGKGPMNAFLSKDLPAAAQGLRSQADDCIRGAFRPRGGRDERVQRFEIGQHGDCWGHAAAEAVGTEAPVPTRGFARELASALHGDKRVGSTRSAAQSTP